MVLPGTLQGHADGIDGMLARRKSAAAAPAGPPAGAEDVPVA
jgi:hypothetical protein